MSLNSQYFGSSSCLSLASLPLPDSAERNVDIRGKSVRVSTQKKRKLEGLSKQRLAVCMIKWFLYQSVGMSTRPLVSFKTMTLWLQRRVSPKPCLMWKYINFGIVLPWSMLTLPFTFTDFLPLVFLRASMLPFSLPSTSFQLRSDSGPVLSNLLNFLVFLHSPFSISSCQALEAGPCAMPVVWPPSSSY